MKVRKERAFVPSVLKNKEIKLNKRIKKKYI